MIWRVVYGLLIVGVLAFVFTRTMKASGGSAGPIPATSAAS